jgi:flagellin-like hook-associated protein FlgL
MERLATGKRINSAADDAAVYNDFNNLGNTWRYASMGQDYWSS